MTDTVADTADTIWERRENLGLSRERVAARLEPPIAAKTLERWEKGTSPLPGWRLVQLEAIYAAFEGLAA